jgi:hypothetical protein
LLSNWCFRQFDFGYAGQVGSAHALRYTSFISNVIHQARS